MRRSRLVCLGLLLSAAFIGCGKSSDGKSAGRKAAPAFDLPTVGGGRARMQDLRGKVVLLDFWASYCGPCLEAMPELQGLLERRRSQGLEVLGVGLESSEGLAAEFLRAAGVRYPSVLDVDGAVSRSYGVRGLPTAILIGKDGSVRRVWTGYEPGLIQEIDAAASALLEEGTVRGG